MEFTIEELEEIIHCIGVAICEGFYDSKTIELEERIEKYLKEVKGENE